VDLHFSTITLLYLLEDIVKRSAPLQYKYTEDNIPATIARVIFDNEKENKKSRIYYSKIKSRAEQLLHHPISDSQMCKNLDIMVNEGLLKRDDPTGKRGSKVYFSLTRECKAKHALKILGGSKVVEKQRRLYSLLIFFEIYKRMALLTKRQLAKLLESVGSSLSDLHIIQKKT
jgi:hypothetical protein